MFFAVAVVTGCGFQPGFSYLSTTLSSELSARMSNRPRPAVSAIANWYPCGIFATGCARHRICLPNAGRLSESRAKPRLADQLAAIRPALSAVRQAATGRLFKNPRREPNRRLQQETAYFTPLGGESKRFPGPAGRTLTSALTPPTPKIIEVH